VAKREILPDPKYHNQTVAKFINHVMVSGKKAVAEKIVYGALDRIEAKEHNDPVEVFEKALDAVAPFVEVKSRRVGGATYQVPIEVRPSRRAALAMRWLVDSARSRSEKSMSARLAGELIDASEGGKTLTVWQTQIKRFPTIDFESKAHSNTVERSKLWRAVRR
jgi:small subunit ribosomal protein S7